MDMQLTKETVAITDMVDLIEKIKDYKDGQGLVHLHSRAKNPGRWISENGTLFLTEYILTLQEMHKVINTHTSWRLLNQEIKNAEKAIQSCVVAKGLTRRDDSRSEAVDSMDNHTALLVFSKVFAKGEFSLFAKHFVEHGEEVECEGVDDFNYQDATAERNVKWYKVLKLFYPDGKIKNYWNVTNPNRFNFFAWYGRSPGFMAMARLAAGRFVGPWGLLAFWVGQMWSGLFTRWDGRATSMDGIKLSYIAWQLVRNRSMFWKLSYKLWYSLCTYKLSSATPIAHAYNLYFGKTDPDHPLCKYMIV
jgi:hypothetical protein